MHEARTRQDRSTRPARRRSRVIHRAVAPGNVRHAARASDRGLVERALALYREEYGDAGLFENHVYDGVAQMLDHVRLITPALFVATLKPKVYAERIVHHLGLDRYFAGVYGPKLEGRFDDTTCSLICWRLKGSRPSARS